MERGLAKVRPINAPFVRKKGPTAIMTRYPSRLLTPFLAHITNFTQTLVLGPKMGWSKAQGGFAAGFRRGRRVLSTWQTDFDCESKCTV